MRFQALRRGSFGALARSSKREISVLARLYSPAARLTLAQPPIEAGLSGPWWITVDNTLNRTERFTSAEYEGRISFLRQVHKHNSRKNRARDSRQEIP